MSIIQVEDVSMRFNLAQEKTETLKEYTVKLLKHQLFFNEFYALRDISFKIEPGESVALIGRNGSGKSTMLKLIAGVMYPTTGSVTVNGEIAPLIELGAGFDLDLTARENVFLNGAVLGHDRAYMQEHFQNIIDFAELWDFVDVPVKNYSSGMIARLGFSIATEVRADILACDEILSVGDFMFQQKCHQRMEQMLSGGTTLLFVSHDINQVKQLCKRAIWIDHGHLRGDIQPLLRAQRKLGSVFRDDLCEAGELHVAYFQQIIDDALVVLADCTRCGKHLRRDARPAHRLFRVHFQSGEHQPHQAGTPFAAGAIDLARDLIQIDAGAQACSSGKHRLRSRALIAKAPRIGHDGDVQPGRHFHGQRHAQRLYQHLRQLPYGGCVTVYIVDVAKPGIRGMMIQHRSRGAGFKQLKPVAQARQLRYVHGKARLRHKRHLLCGRNDHTARKRIEHMRHAVRQIDERALAQRLKRERQRNAAARRVAIRIDVTKYTVIIVLNEVIRQLSYCLHRAVSPSGSG